MGTLAEAVKCAPQTSEEEEDERVKCVGGDKSSLTSPLWISCFLFIVAPKCCPMKITGFQPLTQAEQKHILRRMPYCFSASSHLITWPVWPATHSHWTVCTSQWIIVQRCDQVAALTLSLIDPLIAITAHMLSLWPNILWMHWRWSGWRRQVDNISIKNGELWWSSQWTLTHLLFLKCS